MEVITPHRSAARPAVLPIIGGTVIATLLIVFGVVLAWLALATSFLSAILPPPRADAGRLVGGMILWTAALVAPAIFVLVGTNRLARILGAARSRMPRRSTIARALGDQPEGIYVASGLVLPDGRGVGELVIGPFGAAVVRELPPAEVTRIRNDQWEIRVKRGWASLDNPLERAARDAERVRRWLGDGDADFIVKTYAAVVGTDPTVARTSACAVITPEQVTAWIAGLPPQRSLTPGRRDRLVAMVRAAAG